jgi:hypothetical protein
VEGSPNYSLNMTPVPQTPGSNIASVFLPAVERDGRARTLLDYNYFSLEIDGEWKNDFNVYTGPDDAIWPVMDLVFVLDTTSSMGSELNQVRSGITNILINLDAARVDYRLGGVEYKDEIIDIFPLTEDVDEFLEWYDNLYANGGIYTLRDTIDALMIGINGMDWRRGATRNIIAASDYGINEYNTAFSISDVVNRAREEGIVINAAYVWYYHPNLSDVAASTGGKWTTYFNLSGIDLLTASYALWWNDDSPATEPHFVLVSIYDSLQDKLYNNPWQTVWRLHNY